MDDPILNTQTQARAYLDKAETYTKLGLRAQVQYELEQARRVDPYIVQGLRYRTLLEANAVQGKKVEELKLPLRVGAGMLFVNAVLGVIFLIIILATGGGGSLASGDIIAPVVNLIIGANLWQLKVNWQTYTVWWAAIGLILFGFAAFTSGDYFSMITQASFSGSLILLLVGTPSKLRTIAAVAVFLIFYLGLICLLFGLSFLGILG